MSYEAEELFLFRVWPDLTVQLYDDLPYEWMSDDYVTLWARDESHAIDKYLSI